MAAMPLGYPTCDMKSLNRVALTNRIEPPLLRGEPRDLNEERS